MEKLWTSSVIVSNGSIEFPIGKSFPTANCPLKLFRAIIANADTGSLKFLHTLFDTYLDHMLVKVEPKVLKLFLTKL